ncbi:ectodysplasin-A-like [Lampetra fluviatilis]
MGGVIRDWDVASITHEFRAHTRHGELEVMRAGLYHLYAQVQVRFSHSADSAWQELQVDDLTVARCPLTPATADGGGGHNHHNHHHHHHHHLSACYTARALVLTPHQKVRVRVTLAGGVASEGGGAVGGVAPPHEVEGGGARNVIVHMDPEATFFGAVRLGDGAT